NNVWRVTSSGTSVIGAPLLSTIAAASGSKAKLSSRSPPGPLNAPPKTINAPRASARWGASDTARATLVSGPVATRRIPPGGRPPRQRQRQPVVDVRARNAVSEVAVQHHAHAAPLDRRRPLPGRQTQDAQQQVHKAGVVHLLAYLRVGGTAREHVREGLVPA